MRHPQGCLFARGRCGPSTHIVAAVSIGKARATMLERAHVMPARRVSVLEEISTVPLAGPCKDAAAAAGAATLHIDDLGALDVGAMRIQAVLVTALFVTVSVG